MARVAIFGGGVGGLSTAHELIERGFEVAVFEQHQIWGGKARSYGATGSGTDRRKDLPGEHGFRLFPGFYRHVTDTMKRIPFRGNRHVFDNLVSIEQMLLASEKRPPLVLNVAFPRRLAELLAEPNFLLFSQRMGIPLDEAMFFVHKMLVILTSCYERRLAEYERWPWWDFIEAERKSPAYREQLAEGLTRKLVAMQAKQASTRTVGDIGIQLFQDLIRPGRTSDRVLNGPTNDVWIDPWMAYLRQKGVVFHPHARLQQLIYADKRMRSATVEIDRSDVEIEADYYVCAMPCEVMARLLTPELKAAAPSMANLDQLHTEWMVGIQIYLRRDISVHPGHVTYTDSKWALTSISQHQFWPDVNLSQYGDGQVRGILSVDISDWHTPGDHVVHKAAEQCTADEIAKEVWAQIKAHLNHGGLPPLEDADFHSYHLDSSIQLPRAGVRQDERNSEPLLVNTADSWQYRPEADLSNGVYREIPNLFLAADYVRTYTDLATMEGANEAARRAVNGILRDAGSSKPLCTLWPLNEFPIFAPARAYDYVRFKMGYPHALSLPAPLKRPLAMLERLAPEKALETVQELNHYQFKSIWDVNARPEEIWPLLADPSTFPQWWPQFVKAERINRIEGIGAIWQMEIHASLPYHLHYTVELVRANEPEVVAWQARGDLNGQLSFTLRAAGGGTEILYDSDVRTGNLILKLLAPVGKPLFRWNHDDMMQHGLEGLRAELIRRSTQPRPESPGPHKDAPRLPDRGRPPSPRHAELKEDEERDEALEANPR